MKKAFALILCLILLGTSIPVYATDDNATTAAISENGLIVVDELIIETPNARASEKSATRKRSLYDGDTLIAVITFTATFRYDGTSVSVVSKSVTQTDTYSGWSYKQASFTSSGGTVTLTGTLKYLLIFNPTTFTMSMTCDANGNISY